MSPSNQLTGRTHAMRLFSIRVNLAWADWKKYLAENRDPASFALVAHDKHFDADDEFKIKDLAKVFWMKESDFRKSPEGYPEIKMELFLKSGDLEFDSSLYSMAYKRETWIWHWVFRNTKLSELGTVWDKVLKDAKRTKSNPLVNQYGLYQLTKPFGKEWGGYTVHTWLLPTVRGYFDGHMHTQSNRCAPLPLVWDKLPGKIELGWGTMESWIATAVKPELAGTGKMASDLIGAKALGELPTTTNGIALGAASDIYHPKADHFLTPLMMDMEYGHVRGYDGYPIYEQNSKGKIGWHPNPENLKFFKEVDLKDAQKLEPFELQLIRTRIAACSRAGAWKMLPYFHYDPRRWKSTARNRESFKQSFKGERFSLQSTKIPELQKWIAEVDPDNHFEKIPLELVNGEGSALSKIKTPFIGMKLYSSLGYRPDDFYRLPNLNTLYSHCQNHGIPIMNHCTDEGMYTHQRRYYYNFLRNDPGFKKVPELDDLLVKYKKLEEDLTSGRENLDYESASLVLEALEKELDKLASIWFIEHFIHPSASEAVALKYPKLRVCLAHFADANNFKPKYGGFFTNGSEIDTKSSPWLKALFGLIRQDNQFHADLSYVIFDDKNWIGFEVFFRWANEHRPWLLDRILWGSDWFMIGLDGIKSPMLQNYNKNNFKYLKRLEFGLELWIRFTYINPVRFLNLKKRAANIEKCLDQSAPEWIAKMPETWDEYLEMNKKPF